MIGRKGERRIIHYEMKVCTIVGDGIVCAAVCAAESFIGADVSEIVFNAHKEAILKALEKTADQFAKKWVRRFTPVAGKIDILNDGYQTIVCTTDCVKN